MCITQFQIKNWVDKPTTGGTLMSYKSGCGDNLVNPVLPYHPLVLKFTDMSLEQHDLFGHKICFPPFLSRVLN